MAKTLQGVGTILCSTPLSDKERQDNRKAIASAIEGATKDAPAVTPLKITKGIGGFLINHDDGGVLRPIGNLIFPAKDVTAGTISSKEEAEAFINNGSLEPRIIGKHGAHILLSFFKVENSASADVITLKDATAEALAKGFSQEAIDFRVEYMRREKVSDLLISWVIYQLDTTGFGDGFEPMPTSLYRAGEEKNAFGHDEKDTVISRMLRSIYLGEAVMLDGAKSLGKNVAWETIFWLLNYHCFQQTMSNNTTKEDLWGGYSTDNSAQQMLSTDNLKGLFKWGAKLKKGVKEALEEQDSKSPLDFMLAVIRCMSTSLKFEKASVALALTTKRGGVILDEFNLGRPEELSSTVNTLADDHSTSFFIPGLGNLPIPKGFILGATQNGASCGYAGVQTQNEATMSRFNIIHLTTPRGSVADIFMDAKTGASRSAVEKADLIFQEIREMSEVGSISDTALSIRGFKSMLRHVALGQSLESALLDCVLNACEKEEIEVIHSVLSAKGLL